MNEPNNQGPSPYAPPPGANPYASPYANPTDAGNPYANANPNPSGGADNPFASPPANPYAPPVNNAYTDAEPLSFEDPGNFWLGFLAAFFFALLGLLIVWIRGKPESKRGAAWGFGIRFGLGLLVGLAGALAG